MKRSLFIVAFVVFLITPSVRGEESAGDWNDDVIRLFSLEKRDEALQKLLREGRYPEKPAYIEDNAGRIKEVVVCPQRVGKPLVTVFAGSKFDPEDVSPRSGHLIVIRNDGMILPFYHGANSLDGHFGDLNGDGIVEYLDSWGFRCDKGTLTGECSRASVRVSRP